MFFLLSHLTYYHLRWYQCLELCTGTYKKLTLKIFSIIFSKMLNFMDVFLFQQTFCVFSCQSATMNMLFSFFRLGISELLIIFAD